MQCVVLNCRQLPTVVGGYTLHSNAPSIVEHEGTIDKEHVDGEVGLLVLSEQGKGCGPVIIHLLDVMSQHILEGRLAGFSCQDEVMVDLVNPVSVPDW